MKKSYKIAALLMLSSTLLLTGCHKNSSQSKTHSSSAKTSQTSKTHSQKEVLKISLPNPVIRIKPMEEPPLPQALLIKALTIIKLVHQVLILRPFLTETSLVLLGLGKIPMVRLQFLTTMAWFQIPKSSLRKELAEKKLSLALAQKIQKSVVQSSLSSLRVYQPSEVKPINRMPQQWVKVNRLKVLRIIGLVDELLKSLLEVVVFFRKI